MFAAIDQNATGGKLVASGVRPDDAALFALLNKPMLIKVMVWEFNDRSGNWISKVSPRSQQAAPVAQPLTAAQMPEAEMDSDIPF
jgi:DNA primase